MPKLNFNWEVKGGSIKGKSASEKMIKHISQDDN